MKRLSSILLIFSLMLLHQECRVSNIDPEAVTTTTPDGSMTVIGTPVLNDNVFVIDSSTVDILSITSNQIVLKGALKFKNKPEKGGRLRAEPCGANLLTREKIVGISGLARMPTVRLVQDAICTIDASGGVVTTLYYSAELPPLTGINGVFKYLKLFVKKRYNSVQQTNDIEINKSSVKLIDANGVKVNASENVKIAITNKYTAEFTADIDYGNAQNPDNPDLQKLNYLGVSFAFNDSFSAQAKLEAEVNASITVKLIKDFDLGKSIYPIGNTGLFFNISGTFDLPATLAVKGTLKASGKLVDKTFRFRWGKEYRDGDTGLRDIESIPSQEGEWLVLDKGTIDLDFRICLTPTITVNIGQIDWLIFKLLDAPTNLVLSLGLCYGTKYTCSTTGNGISMANYIEIEPKATFNLSLISTLKESVEKYLKEYGPSLTIETKLLLGKIAKIPSRWSLPDAEYSTPPFKNGKITIPQGAPIVIFKDILCNGAQVADTVVTNPQPTGPCISSTIVTYLTSPVTVGKRGLSGFSSLADGEGSTPPTFANGSIFRVIPTLHSSSRDEDAIYVEKEFGELRLRFTYPNGKLQVDIRQYDAQGSLLLNEQSTPAEVTGQGNTFRICASMAGMTNGKSYRNKVVIMGKLNTTLNATAISSFNYVMLVEGGNTTDYLLNGRSIRLFRAERDAVNTDRFRLSADEQPHTGSGLNLMTHL